MGEHTYFWSLLTMGDNDSVNAISLSLPPPSLSKLSAWFRSFEAQFRSRGIRKQEAMFWHVAAALPECWIAKFVPDNDEDINPNSCDDGLKRAMLESIKLSEKKGFTVLMSSIELADQKSSELLRHLEKLEEGRILGKTFLLELLLRKLPGMARTLLATQPDATTLR